MPNAVKNSTVALFADDSKCFKTIRSPGDCSSLQHDLDSLYYWGLKWKMSFNIGKCHVMSLVLNRHNLIDYCWEGTKKGGEYQRPGGADRVYTLLELPC